MKHLFVSLFMLLSVNLVSASTLSWIGGVGDWNDPANWDLNQVPQNGDMAYIAGTTSEVTIPTGFFAEATQVYVDDQATLIVDGQLVLAKVNLAPLLNHGQIYVNGQVEISDPKVASSIAYRGHENSVLEIAPNGEMNILRMEIGVMLYDDAIVNIRGDMHIVENGTQAFSLNHQNQIFIADGGLLYFEDIRQGLLVQQLARVDNHGEIIFTGNVLTSPITVYGGLLINYMTGSISIYDSGTQAIGNTGVVHNYGEMLIANAGWFVNSEGSFVNGSGANLKMANSDNLTVSGTGERIENYGVIDIQNPIGQALGLSGDAKLENYSSGKIYIDGPSASRGLNLGSGASVSNEGFIRIKVPTSAAAIYIPTASSSYFNIGCSRTSILGGHINLIYGSLINSSWLFLKDPNAIHSLNSASNFANNGVIADRFATLTGLNYTNQGFVTNPLQGPLVAGQAVPNTFTLGSPANVSNPSIRISHNGPSAGTYSLGSNIYVPNAAAVGDGDLRLRITRNGCGAKWFRIPVDNPTPFVGQTNTNLNLNNSKLVGQIFPNPATADIQIHHGLEQEEDIQLELWTLGGQLISQQIFNAVPASPIHFSRPAGLANGSYVLRVVSARQEPSSRRILWQ